MYKRKYTKTTIISSYSGLRGRRSKGREKGKLDARSEEIGGVRSLPSPSDRGF